MRERHYIWGTMLLLAGMVGCASPNEEKNFNVDLAGAVLLKAEQVSTPASALPPTGDGPPAIPAGVHSIFSHPVGTVQSQSVLGGVIDPAGNSLLDDFDGDGIRNEHELSSNIWVADYPVIEASIAVPVIMKIKLITTRNDVSDELTSDITDADMESRKHQGTEKFHQNEVNERTEKFQDFIFENSSVSASEKEAASFHAQAGGGFMGFGGSAGGSSGYSTESSHGQESGFSIQETEFKDVPFKNNLDRDARSVNSTKAETKARKYRAEKNRRAGEITEIKPNAGLVQAAFFLENHSVDMPVRISRVLASLVFETPEGQIVPVQSFRLRNEDFSFFETDVYGGERKGPFALELSGLNTVEVEKAIQLGYTPKVYIVDYKMTHVQDSNYRARLLNYHGDNVKVVEENAKGRTALIKAVGPNKREMFRVAAFDDNVLSEDVDCENSAQALNPAPGLSLKKALKRVACGGYPIEFQHYLLDLKSIFPGMKAEEKVLVYGIKSFLGAETHIDCETRQEEVNGETVPVCIQTKDFKDWDANIRQEGGIWVVFANGKLYNHSTYVKNSSGEKVTFRLANGDVPLLEGVNSKIWVGDNYDIVYLKFKDFKQAKENFGTDPLDTEEPFALNTFWDMESLGSNPFYPGQHSVFLGRMGLGNEFELRFKLTGTRYLNPQVQELDLGAQAGAIYGDFTYNRDRIKSEKSFALNEILDFDLSMGLGGTYLHWYNLKGRDLMGSGNRPEICGTNVDYVNQEYVVCVRLPDTHPEVDPDVGVVGLFLRPSYNVAYRNSFWPEDVRFLKKFKGSLESAALENTDTLILRNFSGDIQDGDQLLFENGKDVYTVNGQSSVNGIITLTLGSSLTQTYGAGEIVYVSSSQTTSPYVHFVSHTEFQDWNQRYNAFNPSTWNIETVGKLGTADYSYCERNDFSMVYCLGYNLHQTVANWIGFNNYGNPKWNAWAEVSKLQDFIQGGLKTTLQDMKLIADHQFDDALALLDINVHRIGTEQSPSVSSGKGKYFRTYGKPGTGAELSNNEFDSGTVYTRIINGDTGASEDNFLMNQFLSKKFSSKVDTSVCPANPDAPFGVNITWMQTDRLDQIQQSLKFGSFNQVLIRYTTTYQDKCTKNNQAVDYHDDVSVLALLSDRDTKDPSRMSFIASNAGKAGFISGVQRRLGYIYFYKGGKLMIARTAYLGETKTYTAIGGLPKEPDFLTAVIAENYFLVLIWGYNNEREFNYRVLEFNSGSYGTMDIRATGKIGDGSRAVSKPVISTDNNRIFLLWEETDFSKAQELMGSVINVSSAPYEFSTPFAVNSYADGNQQNAAMALGDNKAFICWESSGAADVDTDIRCRWRDLQSNSFAGPDYSPAAKVAGNQTKPLMRIEDLRTVLLWQDDEPGKPRNFYSRWLDTYKNNLPKPFDFEIFSDSGANYSAGLEINEDGVTEAIFQSSGRNIRSRSLKFRTTTVDRKAHDFFSAPLIERDFEVKARRRNSIGGGQ